jgi:DNA polymerase-1
MILQVHDELVFELPPDEETALRSLASTAMRHAPELSVPLDVEMGSGRDWRAAH